MSTQLLDQILQSFQSDINNLYTNFDVDTANNLFKQLVNTEKKVLTYAKTESEARSYFVEIKRLQNEITRYALANNKALTYIFA